MNEKIGNVSFYDSKSSEYKFDKPYSENTAQTIDEEVRKLIEFAYVKTIDLLKERKNELEKIAKELLEKEILFQADLEKLIGKRPFDKETTYEKFTKLKKVDEVVTDVTHEEVEAEADDKKEDVIENKD
jgi:cell division protease FtsH